MDVYTGRYHSKIGLNFTLMIFPLLPIFLYGQKYIPMPIYVRIAVIKLTLIVLPAVLGLTGIKLGYKGYKEADAFGIFVMILAFMSMAITLWFAFKILNDISFLYKYGFLNK